MYSTRHSKQLHPLSFPFSSFTVTKNAISTHNNAHTALTIVVVCVHGLTRHKTIVIHGLRLCQL